MMNCIWRWGWKSGKEIKETKVETTNSNGVETARIKYLENLITDFIFHTTDPYFKGWNYNGYGFDRICLFGLYVEHLKEEKKRKAEEDRIRAHVESILKEKGLLTQ
jgi:hypothetical protein